MPSERPGQRFDAVATKTTGHNKPVVELNHAGIAAKSEQALPAVPSVANAAAAQVIAIGEAFVIMLSGVHEFPSTLLPGGAKAGDRIAIKASDNSLVAVANAAAANKAIEEGLLVKFGVVDSLDAVTGLCKVNLTARNSF